MSMFIDVVRGAAAGTVVAHVLSRVLRFVGKILYEIMLEGFLCLTKPSKRAVHGAVSPCPGVHAGAFLRFMGIILQYLSRCANRSFGSTSAGGKFPVRRSPSLTLSLSSTQKAFNHIVRGVSRRSDCLAFL